MPEDSLVQHDEIVIMYLRKALGLAAGSRQSTQGEIFTATLVRLVQAAQLQARQPGVILTCYGIQRAGSVYQIAARQTH